MNEQVDLNLKPLPLGEEEKVTRTKVYTAEYFKVSISEKTDIGEGQKRKNWIAEHMKAFLPLPTGHEGEKFQEDLEKFVTYL